jgi:hypothetical protein
VLFEQDQGLVLELYRSFARFEQGLGQELNMSLVLLVQAPPQQERVLESERNKNWAIFEREQAPAPKSMMAELAMVQVLGQNMK